MRGLPKQKVSAKSIPTIEKIVTKAPILIRSNTGFSKSNLIAFLRVINHSLEGEGSPFRVSLERSGKSDQHILFKILVEE